MKSIGQMKLEDYSSRVSRLNIPIPGFIKFHQTSSEELDDKHYIGRQGIIAKLKDWLEDRSTGSLFFRIKNRIQKDKAYTGAYLITGYRGMGKSSYVGKVLFDITHHFGYFFKLFYYFWGAVIFVIFGLFEFHYIKLRINNTSLYDLELIIQFIKEAAIKTSKFSVLLTYTFIIILILFCIISIFMHFWGKGDKKAEWKKIKSYFSFKTITYIPIKVNVGHEVLNDRDMLCLVSKGLQDKFEDFIKNPTEHKTYSYVSLVIKLLLAFLIANCININPNSYIYLDPAKWYYNFIIYIENLLRSIYHFNPILYELEWFAIIFYIINHYFEDLLSFIIRITRYPYFNLGLILQDIKLLNERIDSTVSEENGLGTLSDNLQSVFSKKKKEYALISVREIEHSLIQIFDRTLYISLAANIRFIVVFDELDKIDPDTSAKKENDKSEHNLPEFDPSLSGFSAGATTRRRRQEVLNTLARMKYFMSTAKAKFIFIAGRELYDAFLADVSDREFSVSSVFNGVINVNSFFKPTSPSEDVSSMTEKYLCKRLFPINYIAKAKHSFDFTLRDYHNYCFDKIWTKYKSTPEVFEREDRLLKQRIHFLYYFSLYLCHMGNGSPKKIALYFEKFVRSKAYLDKLAEDQGVFSDDQHTDYYLTFRASDQFQIGFIHYIVVP